MNSINNLNAITINFSNPWLLLLIIPAVALMLWPYLRLPKRHRNTRNRVISLALHSLILLLVVSMLAGMTFTSSQTSYKKDVVLLVDLSESNVESQEEMNEFVQSVLDGVESGYRVGVVTFANGCVYSSKLSENMNGVYNDYVNSSQTPLKNATDFSSALLYVRDSVLNSPNDGRIIILSDGEQTDGNALATVKALADDGIRIDTVYFPSKGYANEVQLKSVHVPNNVMLGETVDVVVTTESSSVQSATLNFYDNGEMVDYQIVELPVGEGVYSFSYRVSTAKLHELSVTVQSQSDTLLQNNTCYAFINIEASTKALLVDGGGQSEKLLELIGNNYDITKVNVNQLPTTVEELCAYDEVIFMNVANADLPDGFDTILTDYVKNYGGGLFTIGGDKSYVQSDMEGSLYQDLLPVEANTDAKSLGLLLVLDCSGSMMETAQGSTEKRIDLAIQAAIDSVNALSDNDYIGVVTFNQTAKQLVDMTPIERKDTVINRIKQIETATGTYYYDALTVANNMLQAFDDTELKHIIFLTDGEPVDATTAGFMEIIDRMARNDITLSTIALGPSVSSDTAEEMAERGGGRFYSVVRESQLSSVIVEETTIAAGHYYNEVTFTPKIDSHTAVVAGLNELPQLGGFYGTRLKDGATMVLSHEGNPIYAEWTCGLGRVGSFMSDLNGTWSEEFLSDENGVLFINNTVSHLFSTVLQNEIDRGTVTFAHDNFTTTAEISFELAGNENLTAELQSPNGETASVSLTETSTNTFVASFTTDVAGVYTLRLKVASPSGQEEYCSYTTFSYSSEYQAFANDSQCFQFMESLSQNGNGSMLFSADNLFGKENESVQRTYNPKLLFLIICSVAFLLDIVSRKFKIKWPSEILADIREKKAKHK